MPRFAVWSQQEWFGSEENYQTLSVEPSVFCPSFPVFFLFISLCQNYIQLQMYSHCLWLYFHSHLSLTSLSTNPNVFILLSDLQMDYSLTDDFNKNHFLVALLLREVRAALQELREIRQIAIHVLKNLMMKHTFDDRYTSKVSSALLPPSLAFPLHFRIGRVWSWETL